MKGNQVAGLLLLGLGLCGCKTQQPPALGEPLAGLTQEQLAERMHTTQAVIARLESGRVKPSTRTLERLAAATGMRLRISFEPAPAN